MALLVVPAVTGVGPVTADNTVTCVLSITNTGANAVTVQSIQVCEQSQTGAVIRQPDFLTPNVAPGTGQPVIAAAATSNFPFAVCCCVPNTPDGSPNAPNTLIGNTCPPSNTVVSLVAIVQTNDPTAGVNVNGSGLLQFPVGSAVAPFPVPAGGSLQFNAPGDAVNWFF